MMSHQMIDHLSNQLALDKSHFTVRFYENNVTMILNLFEVWPLSNVGCYRSAWSIFLLHFIRIVVIEIMIIHWTCTFSSESASRKRMISIEAFMALDIYAYAILNNYILYLYNEGITPWMMSDYLFVYYFITIPADLSTNSIFNRYFS